MGKIRALQGLVHEILSPCLVKSSALGSLWLVELVTSSAASGFSGCWGHLGKGLKWSIWILMHSALLILPISVEEEIHRHSGTLERLSFHALEPQFHQFLLAESRAAQVREGQEILRPFSLWVKFYMTPQFRKQISSSQVCWCRTSQRESMGFPKMALAWSWLV